MVRSPSDLGSITTRMAVADLAGAYRIAGESGSLTPAGREHLRRLWLRLDPDFTLLEAVVQEVNGCYARDRQSFLEEVGVLRQLVELFCPPLVVVPEDLRHALHDLDPPKAYRLSFLSVDVGAVLASLLPLGEGGTTRARFCLVALANRGWRCEPKANDRELWQQLLRWLGIGLTASGIRVVDCVTRAVTLYAFVHRSRSIVTGALNPGLRWSWHCFQVIMLVSLNRAIQRYRKAMLPLWPILTLRLHRHLLQSGHLLPTDFAPQTTFGGSGDGVALAEPH